MNCRSRKSTLLKLGVFLLLGAIVNVAVAWTIALTVDPRERGPNISISVTNGSDWWTLWRSSKLGTVRISSMRVLQGPTQMPVRTVSPAELGEKWFGLTSEIFREGPGTIWAATVRGWPSSVLWSEEVYRENSRVVHGSVELPLPAFDDRTPRVIPLRPLWPGFAINTIFFAAILWLLWVAPRGLGKIRRFVRIRQHRCPACGFIIAKDTCANGLCSECGATLPERVRRTA